MRKSRKKEGLYPEDQWTGKLVDKAILTQALSNLEAKISSQ